MGKLAIRKLLGGRGQALQFLKNPLENCELVKSILCNTFGCNNCVSVCMNL